MRWLSRILLLLVLLAAAGLGAGYGVLRASLPRLDGQWSLPGLDAPVAIVRDAAGVPTIRAGHREDATRALGFLHAQERYFQMDLLRRSAAGELAELFGAAALDYDRAVRVHRFRDRVATNLDQLTTSERTLLRAYADGVNAGLGALTAAPFEYWLLRAHPRPWRPEDTLLAVQAMYLDLQSKAAELERARGLLWDVLPAPVAAFLDPPGTPWDAPLVGEAFRLPSPPGPEWADWRAWPTGVEPEPLETDPVVGSNAWAVAGALTAHGSALLANDMHLGLRLPPVWYRVVLDFPHDGDRRRVVGVTLPGAPAMVVGSNGHLAWGFTNSYGDWTDRVTLEPVDDDHYRGPDGPLPYRRRETLIRISGGSEELLTLTETRWGPVVGQDHLGRRQALRWVAHTPQAVNLALMALETADSVAEGLAIAARAGLPAQNIVLADRAGRIGWTLAGPVPDRAGCNARRPLDWEQADRCWRGWLAPGDYPRVVDPPTGRIWTANARVVNGTALDRLGDGGYALGARAGQIRDRLVVLDRADERAMLAIQLDERARFLDRWRNLLLALLDPQALAGRAQRAELREQVATWDGHAGTESVGYRVVRRFRETVAGYVFAPVNGRLRALDPAFDYGLFRQHEGPLWTLLNERPGHWLDPRYADWRDLLLAAVDAVIAEATAAGPLARWTWGEANTLAMAHPLGRALPWLDPWLSMPADPLPGGRHMPRVQAPRKGASQRLVVAPGREAQGLFHMPGGQSGHPLSPYFGAGHEAWLRGEPTPLLPGPKRYTLQLLPTAGRPD
ncbi:MAG: penicillin acylase family protein [Candidatus Competibacterales bacterium]|nr:penicillin acylase family protein [Candidatus Competibacterales bacterium]